MVISDLDKTIKYWVDSSAYDLATAKSLLEIKRYPYALFFGHLALEKMLKALVVKATQEHAPYTHSLTLLIKRSNIVAPEALLDQLAEYTGFNIETRYPDDKLTLDKSYNKKFTQKKLKEMEEVYKWLTQKL